MLFEGPFAEDLEATYFDTSELALAAAGVTLRRRVGGGDAGWHLKIPPAAAAAPMAPVNGSGQR